MRYLLLITSLLVIGFTSLVSIPGSPYLIGGMTQADISAMFATSITPAGVTFAIWSLIYLSWLVVGLSLSGLPLTHLTKKYFPLFTKSIEKQKLSPRVILSFSAAIALTAIWLIPWGYIWIGTALIIMWTMLAMLGYAFFHMRQSHIIVRSSIELTFAWIIMATALNTTVWMRYIWWDRGGPEDFSYAIGALAIILLIVSYLQHRYRTYILSVVFLWTLLGIWVAHPVMEERSVIVLYILITLGNMVYHSRKK